ncbi:MAG: S41 family peptidase [Candidatus Omnitrophica bacterium]|nr:S41 family peptidase [Candidatus Omnitrophota bacterium]
MKKILYIFFILILFLCSPNAFAKKSFDIDLDKLLFPKGIPVPENTDYYQPYFDFFDEVFSVMQREYYLPVSEKVLSDFKQSYSETILSRLKNKEKIEEKIKYLGSGLLVNKLKEPNDIFSGFFPPKESKEFKEEVLGFTTQGIGITGEKTIYGFVIKRVELRSDSYKKGIRAQDRIIKINNADVLAMSQEQIEEALQAQMGQKISLELISFEKREPYSAEVEVIEFFKETLSSIPTGIAGMYYIKINQFNKATGADFQRVLYYYMTQKMDRLIIDLRGNGGGPPLAAQEIANMFFPIGTDLFYFKKKNYPEIMLKAMFSPFHYNGEVAILIDKKSASASELFAGTMREHNRAILIGQEDSAGKTFLKSMFNLSDGSMLMLVTSPAYLFSGTTFSFSGLEPDFLVPEDVELFPFVYKCFKEYYGK